QKVCPRGRRGARGRRRIAPSSGSVAKLVSTLRRRGRSATQNAAGGLFHRRDDALADRVDLLVGEGFFARLQGDRDGEGFLAFAQRAALEDVEDIGVGDERLVRALGRAQERGGLDVAVEHESEIARERQQGRAVERRL